MGKGKGVNVGRFDSSITRPGADITRPERIRSAGIGTARASFKIAKWNERMLSNIYFGDDAI